MTPRRSAIPAALVLVSALLPACLGLGPEEEEALVWYQVEPPAPEPAGDVIDASVVLRPFAHDGSLDPVEIRYRTSDVTSGYWPGHLWSEPVSDMVRASVQRDLAAWGGFREVLLLESAGRADVLLSAVVHRFEEVDAPDAWTAVVEISFEAVSATDGSLVWHRRIRAVEPSAKKNVVEVVRALGRALGRVSAEMRAGLSEAIR